MYCDNTCIVNNVSNLFATFTEIKYYKTLDGVWGLWTTFGSCVSNCSISGVQSRTRVCNYPQPSHPGSPCAGPNVDARVCKGILCSYLGTL